MSTKKSIKTFYNTSSSIYSEDFYLPKYSLEDIEPLGKKLANAQVLEPWTIHEVHISITGGTDYFTFHKQRIRELFVKAEF